MSFRWTRNFVGADGSDSDDGETVVVTVVVLSSEKVRAMDTTIVSGMVVVYVEVASMVAVEPTRIEIGAEAVLRRLLMHIGTFRQLQALTRDASSSSSSNVSAREPAVTRALSLGGSD